jgi:glycosyltransferase involved in cell wall biosynthesis
LSAIKRSIREGKLEDRVFLLPDIDDDRIPDLYAMTDIFVLPSLVEGLPLTLFEAWASKCTVITSLVGGIPYVVKDGIDGLTVPPNDPVALSKRLEYLILNEEARMRISRNGYARVQNEFSLSNVTQFLIARYHEILSP